MAISNAYLQGIYESVEKKNANEPEFLQAVKEVLETLVPVIEKRPHGLNSVKCGSLVFSLPVSYEKKMHEYERHGVERKFPYCDYELSPTSEWSFGLASDKIEIERNSISSSAFCESAPAVVAKVKVKKINWGYEDGFDTVCAKIPESVKAQSDEIEAEFIPYGCAKLRMTELPFAE